MGPSRHVGLPDRQDWRHALASRSLESVPSAMIFYILVFGLLAVLVVVLGVMRMRGRRPGYAASDDREPGDPTHHPHATGQDPATGHHPHSTKATRRNRKAKRVESRRDRRKRK
jgi:hypothetical protein